MTNWKTTSSGILAIIGSITTLVFTWQKKQLSPEVVTGAAGGIVSGLGLIFARDFDKTSEQSGAGQETTTKTTS